jgi:hypothetical protein
MSRVRAPLLLASAAARLFVVASSHTLAVLNGSIESETLGLQGTTSPRPPRGRPAHRCLDRAMQTGILCLLWVCVTAVPPLWEQLGL